MSTVNMLSTHRSKTSDSQGASNAEGDVLKENKGATIGTQKDHGLEVSLEKRRRKAKYPNSMMLHDVYVYSPHCEGPRYPKCITVVIYDCQVTYADCYELYSYVDHESVPLMVWNYGSLLTYLDPEEPWAANWVSITIIMPAYMDNTCLKNYIGLRELSYHLYHFFGEDWVPLCAGVSPEYTEPADKKEEHGVLSCPIQARHRRYPHYLSNQGRYPFMPWQIDYSTDDWQTSGDEDASRKQLLRKLRSRADQIKRRFY
ncbi:hypothetical protein CPC08DRAFT_768020 [Agrocybe pediades]|nr:hypothetical protein CPC08DRAFT_768020 [Agrocybe pediades]